MISLAVQQRMDEMQKTESTSIKLQQDQISLMTWNIDSNGSGSDTKAALQQKEQPYNSSTIRDQQIQFMKDYSVICVQECQYFNVQYMQNKLGSDYLSESLQVADFKGQKGCVIFYDTSLVKVIEQGSFLFKTQLNNDYQQRGCVWVRTQDNYLIICTHLTSGNFDISSINNNFGIGDSERQSQAKEITNWISQKNWWNYKIIVCGDFNDFNNSVNLLQLNSVAGNVQTLLIFEEDKSIWENIGRLFMNQYSTNLDRIYCNFDQFRQSTILRDVYLSDHYPGIFIGTTPKYFIQSNPMTYFIRNTDVSLSFIQNLGPVNFLNPVQIKTSFLNPLLATLAEWSLYLDKSTKLYQISQGDQLWLNDKIEFTNPSPPGCFYINPLNQICIKDEFQLEQNISKYGRIYIKKI